MAIFYSPVEVIALAVTTEQTGKKLYETAAAHARKPELAELFAFLAREEATHEQVFQGLYEQVRTIPEQLPYDWNEVQEYLKAITDTRFFAGADKAIDQAVNAEDEQRVLDFALEFERATLLFYLEIVPLVSAAARATVENLIGQERNHIRRLAAIRK